MKRRLRQLLVFTTNTLLEAFRNNTLYAVLVAAGLAIGAAVVLGPLSLGQDERIFTNLVFFVGMMFLVALSIYQGVTTLHREIDDKTIFTVLSKPVTREAFLVGKYTASVVVVTVCAMLMFGLKSIFAVLLGYELTTIHLGVYFAGVLQLIIVVAVGFFFSTFSASGPFLSALFTFSIFVIGSLTPQIENASSEFAADGNPVHFLLDATLWVVPDFEKLNLSYELTYQMEIPGSYFLHATGYTSSVVIFILLLSHLIFSRRDFS